MKTVVFGGTGFIGSHVVEQLVIAGHDVAAVVRPSSNTMFLSSLKLKLITRPLDDPRSIRKTMEGIDVVYNCTARPHPNLTMEEHRQVEVYLARDLAKAASDAGVRRFVQLSTIQVNGSRTPSTPINEKTPVRADVPFQKAYIEREQVVREVGDKTSLETVILRPASTIGVRDQASFLSRLYLAYKKGQFPLSRHNNGATRVSLIDTRDLGRAMEWLGRYEKAAGEIYLCKGFDVCWRDLKEKLDQLIGPIPQKKIPPAGLLYLMATVAEWISRPPKIPPLMRFMILALTHDVIIDDSKLRSTGFETAYGFEESIKTALADIQSRM